MPPHREHLMQHRTGWNRDPPTSAATTPRNIAAPTILVVAGEFRRRTTQSLAARMREGDSYGLLLLLIVALYVLTALLPRDRVSTLFFAFLYAATLLLALHTSRVRGRTMRWVAVATVMSIAIALVQLFLDKDAFPGAGYAILLLVAIAPVAIVARVLRHPEVTVESILGAICAYLLIGITFAQLYLAIDAGSAHGFFTQRGPWDGRGQVKFLYFSFVTITTLGYGDLTPGTDAGRMLVTMEALLGQIFLVTLVARLVSSFRGRPATDSPSTDDGS